MSEILMPDMSHQVLDKHIERLSHHLHQYLDYQLSLSRQRDWNPEEVKQAISTYQDMLDIMFGDLLSVADHSLGRQIREMKLMPNNRKGKP